MPKRKGTNPLSNAGQNTQSKKKKKKSTIKDVHEQSRNLKNNNVISAAPTNTTNSIAEISQDIEEPSIEERSTSPVSRTTGGTPSQPSFVFPMSTKKMSTNNEYFVLQTDKIDFNLRTKFYSSPNRSMPNYSRQIGIYLQNNFNADRKQKRNNDNQTSSRRSNRVTSSSSSSMSRSTTPTMSNSTTNVTFPSDNWRRCYVEDAMALDVNEIVFVLVPKKDTSTMKEFTPAFEVTFCKNKYKAYYCKVTSAPYRSKLFNGGISMKDLSDGFGDKNFGFYVSTSPYNSGNNTRSSNNQEEYEYLITWNCVLNGGIHGLQVWRNTMKYRNVFHVFRARKKLRESCEFIMNSLYEEVFGDRVQLGHINNCFHRANSEATSALLTELKKTLHLYEPAILTGETYRSLLCSIDETFRRAIETSFYTFSSINAPLITSESVNKMANSYKTKLPNHYDTMKKMFNYDKKSNQVKNYHLEMNNYYNRRLLHNFIAQSRVINSNNCIHYAIVSTASTYGRGGNSQLLQHSTYAGIAACLKSMFNRFQISHKEMDNNIRSTLRKESILLAALDNNQKGNVIKYQVNGCSNKFFKVTGRFFKKCDDFSYPSNVTTVSEKVKITYLNQAIPSMFNMPMMEYDTTTAEGDGADVVDIQQQLQFEAKFIFNLKPESLIAVTPPPVDFSGRRVQAYISMVETTVSLHCTVSSPYNYKYN